MELDEVAYARVLEDLEPDAGVRRAVHRQAAELVWVGGDVPTVRPVLEQGRPDRRQRARAPR